MAVFLKHQGSHCFFRILFCLATVCHVQSAVIVYSSGTGVGLGKCSGGEFECKSGSCLNQTSVCDGLSDCSDGEDETSCPLNLNCRPDEYGCPNEDKCIPLYQLCDGVRDCANGTDEDICPMTPESSLCDYSRFTCGGECLPFAYLCDGVQNCPDGEDESQCAPPELVLISNDISVTNGERITLTCESSGYPPPIVSWRKDSVPLPVDPRYELVSTLGIGTLTIKIAQLGDSGVYSCELQSRLYGTILSQSSIIVAVNDSNPFVCKDHLNQAYMQTDYYYSVMSFASGPATQAAADIIFVVDESGSMAMEHEWIQKEVNLLDIALRERGVGVGMRPNLFGLVGFGRNDPTSIGGITLSQLARPDEFVLAAGGLQLTGVLEDGYSAIDHALAMIETRSGTAKQVILVTDEDRGVLRVDLSRELIEERLVRTGFMLNVIINQGFLRDPLDDHSFALGLDRNSTAYIVDPDSLTLFNTSDGGSLNPSPFFGFGNSYEDYAVLAHSTGGAAWDLNQLREQGILAEAFTNAFTAVKVEEVMSVFRECFLCLCRYPQEVCSMVTDRVLNECMGFAPVITVNVVPESTLASESSQVVFECIANTNTPGSSLSISWEYPQGSEIVVREKFLSVVNVTSESEGIYTCTVTSNSTGSVIQSSGSASLKFDTRCVLDDRTYLLVGNSRQILSSQNTNRTSAADVILLVDESGSMSMEHAWIPEMIQDLDNALQLIGVGVNPRNQFGIVGFGNDCTDELAFARVLVSPTNQIFFTSDNISDFTENLSVGGRNEDGYSAINAALESYQFRDTAARQFILITDEDRDRLDVNLTRDRIIEMLQDKGIVLNAVVSEEYSGNSLRGLGIDSKASAFIFDPSAKSFFRIIPNSGSSIQDSAYGDTNSDYSQLALDLGGATWDISQLQQGGMLADAFTNAFVYVKVLEVRARMEECVECECTSDGPTCGGPLLNASCSRVPVPSLPGESPLEIELMYTTTIISPGHDLTLYCRVNCTASLGWNFNGGSLPDNVQVSQTNGLSTRLTVANGSVESAGIYTCLAHSATEVYNGISSVRIEFYDPEQDLMLEVTPLEANFPRGGNSTITCSVESPAFITWSFNDGPLPPNALVTESSTLASSLTLQATIDSNNGAYTCTANNTDRGVVNEDTAYINVVDSAIRLSVEPDIFEVMVGSSVDLLCRIDTDFSRVLTEWRRPGGRTLPVQAEVSRTSEEITLLIPNITIEDSGRYTCAAEADGQFTSKDAYITVTEPKTSFEVAVSPSLIVTVGAGNNQSLLCEATQNASSFTWYFNGLEVQKQGESILETDVAPSNVVAVGVSERRSVLSILMAEDGNSGTYECVAISVSGELSEMTVQVTVI